MMPASRVRIPQVESVAAEHIESRRTAIREHHEAMTCHVLLDAERCLQIAEVTIENRLDIGIEHDGARSLVLSPFLGDIGRAGDRDAWQQLT